MNPSVIKVVIYVKFLASFRHCNLGGSLNRLKPIGYKDFSSFFNHVPAQFALFLRDRLRALWKFVEFIGAVSLLRNVCSGENRNL